MELKIYSLEGTKYEGTVPQVTLPATGGEITVLEHHIPLITTLKAGEVKFKDQTVVINGGFAEIGNNKVVVLIN
ncbi:MAG: atpC [Candidatus Taylorbacteria bacterium]|nr:atpC [Candidatus Taylorbacteria bacterium]